MAIYPASGYRGPTSSGEWFFVFKSTEIEGYKKGERKFGRGSLGVVLWLVSDEVGSHQVRETLLSLAGLPGGGTLCCSSRLLYSPGELLCSAF
jgi:hypothetical protein